MFKFIEILFRRSASDQNIIGKFQVINLLSQRVQFEIFCVEPLPADIKQKLTQDPAFTSLLAQMQIFEGSEQLLEEFKSTPARQKDAPVMLLCNTGKKSAKLAAKIAKLGYKNLYILNTGLQELI